MAYSTTNPVRCAVLFGITNAQQLLIYESTHVHADIESTAGGGFFKGCAFGSPSSAGGGTSPVGMKVGDLLMHIHVSSVTSAITMHRVTSISTSTGFGSLLNATISAASS